MYTPPSSAGCKTAVQSPAEKNVPSGLCTYPHGRVYIPSRWRIAPRCAVRRARWAERPSDAILQEIYLCCRTKRALPCPLYDRGADASTHGPRNRRNAWQTSSGPRSTASRRCRSASRRCASRRPSSRRSPRSRWTRSSMRPPWPPTRPASRWPRWPSRRPVTASWRTRSSRTTMPPSTSTTSTRT